MIGVTDAEKRMTIIFVLVLLNLNPHKKTSSKQSKSAENIIARMNTEMEAELAESRKERESFRLERNSLLDSLKRTNEDFIMLKKKRIQDVSMFNVIFLGVSLGKSLQIQKRR